MSEEAIRIEVTRDRGDYLSAVWTNFWRSGAWLWLVGGGAALGAAIAALAARDGDPDALSSGVQTAAIFLVVTIPAYSLLMVSTAWRAWRQPGAMEPLTYTFTSSGIEVQSRIGSSTSQWLVWRRAFENARVLIIRHRLNLMQVLPKRQIPADAMARLKALLRTVLDGRVAFKSETAP